MGIILIILLILGIASYYKIQDINTKNYIQLHKIDWGKVNEDIIMNDSHNFRVNHNILSGNYNMPTITKNDT